MAETLSVAEMIPNKFEPKRQNRWVFALEGIDAFLMKTAARPNFNGNTQTLKFINSTRYLAGRYEFQTMNVTLYDPIAPSGAQQVMEWLRTHYESSAVALAMQIFTRETVRLSFLILLELL